MSYINLSVTNGKIDTVDTVADGIQLDLSNATYGLTAIKNASGTTFTNWELVDAMAPASYYVPAASKIVTSATLENADKLEVYDGAHLITKPIAGTKGIIGMINCDGTDIKFKNTSAGAATIYIKGFSQ